jgi:hypothetical protein
MHRFEEKGLITSCTKLDFNILNLDPINCYISPQSDHLFHAIQNG